MTYQSVNMVLAEVLVVREQLLGVDDAAGIGLETEAAPDRWHVRRYCSYRKYDASAARPC